MMKAEQGGGGDIPSSSLVELSSGLIGQRGVLAPQSPANLDGGTRELGRHSLIDTGLVGYVASSALPLRPLKHL